MWRKSLSKALFLLLTGASIKLRFLTSYNSCHIAALPCPATGLADLDPHLYADIPVQSRPISTALPSDPVFLTGPGCDLPKSTSLPGLSLPCGSA